MQILTIRKGFEAFECKFEPFERDLKHSNAKSNHPKGSRTIPKGFETFESKFEPFERDSKRSNVNSNHSTGIRIQILNIRNKFEAFECKF